VWWAYLVLPDRPVHPVSLVPPGLQVPLDWLERLGQQGLPVLQGQLVVKDQRELKAPWVHPGRLELLERAEPPEVLGPPDFLDLLAVVEYLALLERQDPLEALDPMVLLV